MLLFGFELFSLRTKAVDLVEHPLEKGFRRGCGNPGPLKLEDLLALSPSWVRMRSISDLT
jgi:hypothetical protein